MLQHPQLTLSILDPTSLHGKEIAELVASSFPAARRRLFHTIGEAEHQIADVAGEAAIVPPLQDPDELRGSDAVVVTAIPKPAVASALLEWLRAHPRVILIDTTQPGVAGMEAIPVLDSPRPGSSAGWYQIADPGLVAPAKFVAALAQIEPDLLCLTVLLPVSGFGEEALKDLAGQAAARLSGRTPERGELLPGILAFDASPIGETRRRVLAWQIENLFPSIQIRLQAILAGIFHGHAATVQVHCRKETGQEDLVGLVKKAPGLRMARSREHLCVSGMVGDHKVVCAGLAIAGEWVSAWLAADGLRAGGAQAVVDLLSALRAS